MKEAMPVPQAVIDDEITIDLYEKTKRVVRCDLIAGLTFGVWSGLMRNGGWQTVHVQTHLHGAAERKQLV